MLYNQFCYINNYKKEVYIKILKNNFKIILKSLNEAKNCPVLAVG
jgi:hypothetical protein